MSLLLVIILFAIICTTYLKNLSESTRILREHISIRQAMQTISTAYRYEMNDRHGTSNYMRRVSILQNVANNEGCEILSWRAKILEYAFDGESVSLFQKVDYTSAWNSTQNMEFLQLRPQWCYYPYYSKESRKTCVVGIREILSLPRTQQILNVVKDKAIILVVAPEYAVEWTRPVDVSWEDLAKGKIAPYWPSDKDKDSLFYIRAGDGASLCRSIPKTFDEWRAFCGITEEEEKRIDSLRKMYSEYEGYMRVETK